MLKIVAAKKGEGNSRTLKEFMPLTGLSQTQVVVIVTCSAVIGTFFIIAGVLRIHSCIKRYRANREAALNIARRLSPSGFHSNNVLRRDSQTSKASRQMEEQGNTMGTDTQPPIHPYHPSQEPSDEKPLLADTLHVETLTTNTSHESLPNTDNEEHDTGNNHTGYDHGKEADPLLHQPHDNEKGPENVPLGNVNQIENEFIISRQVSTDSANRSSSSSALCRSRSLASPQRSEIFEPGGETDSEGGEFVNDTIDILVEKNNDKSGDVVNGLEVDANHKCELENETVEGGQHNQSLNKSESTETTYDEVTGFPVYKYKHATPRQYSVDYFEVDENGFEVINPIFEEDETEIPEESHMPSNGLVTTGLCQSDNSLCENPSYQYGNQTEYCVNGDYREHGYSIENSLGINGRTFMPNSPENAASCKVHLSYSLSMPYDHEQRDTFNSSTEMTFDKTKISRMYSSDSYFGRRNKYNNLVHNTDSDGVYTISSSNVKSSIVPMAIYNSGSIEQDQ